MASTLVEELIEEILIRIPPNEPAHLVYAALVCKSWHRIILSGHGFRHHYRKFHRTPPQLGYIRNDDRGRALFFPTTSTTSPVSTAALTTLDDHSYWMALDCRHGRVLIYIVWDDDFKDQDQLMIWDPITGSQQYLNVPSDDLPVGWRRWMTGSVLCAANGCDHLDCGGGPFAVVSVWTPLYYARARGRATCASIYSSETGAWSAPTSINIHGHVDMSPSLLIRDVLYFSVSVGLTWHILKYDLSKRGLSVIDTPRFMTPLVIKGDDRGLQLITVSQDDHCVYIWSQQDTNGICGWVKHKAMELPAQLLEHGYWHQVIVGTVEGADIIFIRTYGGIIFTLNLKSRIVRKVGDTSNLSSIALPYMSFCTPR